MDVFKGVKTTVSQMTEMLYAAWQPEPPVGVVNLSMDPAGWDKLAELIYSQDYSKHIFQVTSNNTMLERLLTAITKNTHTINPNRPGLLTKQQIRKESIAVHLLRVRHKDYVPFLVLIDSSEAFRTCMHRELWDSLCMRRLLMSHTWMERTFFPEMHARFPGCAYEKLESVSMVLFDNFTLKVNYKSLETIAGSGQRLDMTNWATVSIPKRIAPHLNSRTFFHSKCACRTPICVPSAQGTCCVVSVSGAMTDGIFKKDFDKYSIIPDFSPRAAKVLDNKKDRFIRFLVGHGRAWHSL